jgi:anti-sigma B factor antagonist
MARLESESGAQSTVERIFDASGATIVALTGEIDISNAQLVETRLNQLLGDDVTDLVIDLSELQFVDSAGIAMLLRAITRVESVTVRNPSSVVRRIFECTGLTGVLPIER